MLATGSLALAAGLLTSDSAHADAQDIIPESTRPMFFTVGVGPTFYGLGARGDLRGEHGQIGFDFGYHFSGDGEGPAIGASIEQSYDGFYFMFNPAFKFWYDIQIVDDLGIYVAPLAKAGYALEVCDGVRFNRFYGCGTGHAFNIGFGVEGRVVFDDRWMVFFRPVQVDTFAGDFGAGRDAILFNYDIMIGGMVTF